MDQKIVAHIDICVKNDCTLQKETIRNHVQNLLETITLFTDNMFIPFHENLILNSILAYIHIDLPVSGSFSLWQLHFIMHIFQYNYEGKITEELDGAENGSALSQFSLPCYELDGMWESLVYDMNIKNDLISYAESSIMFSNLNVNTNLISLNRVILLYGPPGTGKTSLCKSLAQKLSIRLNHLYAESYLIEINSHSLFSKWFSESGKLVKKLFDFLYEMIEDQNSLIFILIDEVESLTISRQANTNEPSDALRVVNSLLTELDQIRKHNNILILTTSNITTKIDVAFIDRADIKQYIGNPNIEGRYQILTSCLMELMRVGIIEKTDIPHYNEISDNDPLKQLLIKTDGFSGRTLRKLPFLAHCYYLHTTNLNINDYINGILLALDRDLDNRKLMS